MACETKREYNFARQRANCSINCLLLLSLIFTQQQQQQQQRRVFNKLSIERAVWQATAAGNNLPLRRCLALSARITRLDLRVMRARASCQASICRDSLADSSKLSANKNSPQFILEQPLAPLALNHISAVKQSIPTNCNCSSNNNSPAPARWHLRRRQPPLASNTSWTRIGPRRRMVGDELLVVVVEL